MSSSSRWLMSLSKGKSGQTGTHTRKMCEEESIDRRAKEGQMLPVNYQKLELLLLSPQVMSNSLRPHGLQNIRLLCLSLSPRVCSHSCLLSWWCYVTMSSSAVLFSFYPQSFPGAGSFPVSQFFASGGQSIGPSASASVLPVYIQGWFPLGLAGLISLLSKGPLRVFSGTIQKHQCFSTQPSLWSNLHIHLWLLEKWTLVHRVPLAYH